MPLLRALGRWFRKMTVSDESLYSDTRYGSHGASLPAIGCFVTLVAIAAFPVALVVGGAYELVRRADRRNFLSSGGQWIAAVGLAVVVCLVAYLAWRGSA